MSEPLAKKIPLNTDKYRNNTRSRGLQRVALQSVSPVNRQDALHSSQGTECIWIFHDCCILYCTVNSALGACHSPASASQHSIAQRSGVSYMYLEAHHYVFANIICRVKGRPHYYSPKKEEYAHIKFDLDAGKRLHLKTAHSMTDSGQTSPPSSIGTLNRSLSGLPLRIPPLRPLLALLRLRPLFGTRSSILAASLILSILCN